MSGSEVVWCVVVLGTNGLSGDKLPADARFLSFLGTIIIDRSEEYIEGRQYASHIDHLVSSPEHGSKGCSVPHRWA